MSERVVIIGGGFTGLSAALELSKDSNYDIALLEASPELGGLASTFEVNGARLERFYHHWFRSDTYIMELIEELGASDKVRLKPTQTATYFANQHYRLSTPLDLLRFSALSLRGRIRLGLQTLYARQLHDWKRLEGLTAEQWLRRTGGDEVFDKVWWPLLKGKFGPYAGDVGAVWMWNKLKLRGGSRGRGGREELAYFEGGFGALVDLIQSTLIARGVQISVSSRVQRVHASHGKVTCVDAQGTSYQCDHCILTPALPIIADLLADVPSEFATRRFNQVDYLANVCLVLSLNTSLSESYWLNVTDPSFPFVGVIEHTNFIRPEAYGGSHLVYLSKYLPITDPMYGMTTEELVNFSTPHIERMFPDFRRDWIEAAFSWKAPYAQPIVTTHYSQRIPERTGPFPGCYVATMAQIYPEDRGTNYAVREGREAARRIRHV